MKLLRKIGVLSVAAVAGLVAYLYTTDEEVKEKTDTALQNIREAIREITAKHDDEETVVYEIKHDDGWSQHGV